MAEKKKYSHILFSSAGLDLDNIETNAKV